MSDQITWGHSVWQEAAMDRCSESAAPATISWKLEGTCYECNKSALNFIKVEIFYFIVHLKCWGCAILFIACEACSTNSNKKPTWRLKASVIYTTIMCFHSLLSNNYIPEVHVKLQTTPFEYWHWKWLTLGNEKGVACKTGTHPASLIFQVATFIVDTAVIVTVLHKLHFLQNILPFLHQKNGKLYQCWHTAAIMHLVYVFRAAANRISMLSL